MKTRIHLLAAALVLCLTACKKNNDTSASAGSGIAISMRASNPAMVLQRSAAEAAASRTLGLSLQWSSVTAHINLLKFEAKSSGQELEFKSNIAQTVDLLSATGSLGNIAIPAGTFSEVEFKASLTPSGSTPALVMTGQATDANGATPVTFQANEAIEVKGEKNNVVVTATTVHNALIALDLPKVMQGISAADLAAATRTNGTVLITSAVNANLYARIVRNLRNLEDECDFH